MDTVCGKIASTQVLLLLQSDSGNAHIEDVAYLRGLLQTTKKQPYCLRRLLPRQSVPRLQWQIRELRLLLKRWRIKLENELFHSRLLRTGPRLVQDVHFDVPPWLLDEFRDDP